MEILKAVTIKERRRFYVTTVTVKLTQPIASPDYPENAVFEDEITYKTDARIESKLDYNYDQDEIEAIKEKINLSTVAFKTKEFTNSYPTMWFNKPLNIANVMPEGLKIVRTSSIDFVKQNIVGNSLGNIYVTYKGKSMVIEPFSSYAKGYYPTLSRFSYQNLDNKKVTRKTPKVLIKTFMKEVELSLVIEKNKKQEIKELQQYVSDKVIFFTKTFKNYLISVEESQKVYGVKVKFYLETSHGKLEIFHNIETHLYNLAEIENLSLKQVNQILSTLEK